MTPIIGDLVANTIGKAVDKAIDHFLPASMSEGDREAAKLKARELAIDEYKTAIADVQGARELASKESEGAPGWTKLLTVTHRPVWSFVMLAIFAFTVVAPYVGLPNIELSEVHRDVMMTVIVFYFGGRSIEKTVGLVKGR
jgi:hypothetical protein